MTQEKLATALGIALQEVQKYEKGLYRISSSRFRHIARVLDAPIAFGGGSSEHRVDCRVYVGHCRDIVAVSKKVQAR